MTQLGHKVRGEVQAVADAVLALQAVITHPESEDAWEDLAAVASRGELAFDRLYLRARQGLRDAETVTS